MAQRTVVFDFGGVLFKTSATDFYRERFQEQGRTEEELQLFLGTVFTNKDRSSANIGTMREVIDRKAAQYPEWEEEIRAFGAERAFLKQVREIIPGMREVIEDIASKGDRIVGLTNWASDTYDVMPQAFPDILGHFNEVVVSGKVGMKKPGAEIFRLAQKEFGDPNPSDVYYFDDKPANTESARKAAGWNVFTFESADTVRRALALQPKRP